MYKCVVFDLDGTVLNTLDDLADAGNYALACMGFDAHPVENYRYYVGNGIPKLIERILPDGAPADVFERTHELFCSYYENHMNDKTAPYDGIPQALEALKKAGIKLALVSNKAHEFTCDLVKKHFGDIFDVVFGGTADKPKKPDPYWVLRALEILGVKPQETFYAGDSGVDMQTARRAGITACGVLWGFRDREELLLNGADLLCENSGGLASMILGQGF